jgi:hypothetical protein
MEKLDFGIREAATLVCHEGAHHIVEESERNRRREVRLERDSVGRVVSHDGSDGIPGVTSPKRSYVFFQHSCEHIAQENRPLRRIVIAAPSYEVIGALRVDSVAGDFNDADIEPGGVQCVAQLGDEVGFANTS